MSFVSNSDSINYRANTILSTLFRCDSPSNALLLLYSFVVTNESSLDVSTTEIIYTRHSNIF